MTRRVWDKFITEEDRQVYDLAGFGRKGGLGQRPAILIIDVQYRTVGHEPMPIQESMKRFYSTSCGEAGWQAVRCIKDLLEIARPKRVPVIYPYVAPKKAMDSGRLGEKVPTIMNVAQEGYAFVEEIAPAEGDIIIPKKHASAFFGTPLASHLIDLEADTLLVTGCTTSGCVRATVADAFSYNFRVAVVEDCVYDRGKVSHAVNLFDMQQKYADVLSIAEVKNHLVNLSPR
jgi:nicotinamidase-related amidase